ncbi:copper amine oxidase N-terminal domain-containing protein [Cellulosilyticum sp. I15G10I2]|uniref:copper amine oxidase N-terminal domain-containing protein n=1 Tax=Cellulosilyticum sp. I15G10I2 TaxID=1892843 RepID=UPI00085C1F6F|nr:copper amine oxidase N-terminal domain-containing protein [Cellulosilyticum sp. I15G10I2]
MKKFKSYKVLCLTLGLGIALSGTVLNAASITKSLKAVYSNIAISYNGQTKILSSEPFLVNGTTYVPLRAVSEIMGANVNWANNTIYIASQTSSNVSTEQELAAKNFEIASLKQQLDVAKKELETFKGTGTEGSNLTTAAINNTLSKIKDTYYDDYNIDWEFNLRLVSSRLELTVSYDSRYDSSDFAKTTESRRKQFIREICYDIASAHKDTEIRGTLEDSRTDKEVATFRYSKTGSYTYEEESYLSLSEFETELERYYKTINIVTPSIPINAIDLSERSSTLTATLNVNLRTSGTDYRAAWNDISRSNLRKYLDDIIDDIEDEYSTYDKIIIVVKDNSLGLIADYENGSLIINTVSTSN